MGDHLPECGYVNHETLDCICGELRDCEARVRESERRFWTLGLYETDRYAAGLDAARDAISDCDCDGIGRCGCCRAHLAAIDALRATP